MRTVIGVDVGTSGVRALAASEDGAVLSAAQAPLRSFRSADGSIHEQEPEEWWKAICGVCQRVSEGLAAADCLSGVSGVGVTSTSGSLVLTGGNGVPLRRAILYDDSRASAVASLFRDAGFPEVNASYSLAKAAWVQNHEPEVWGHVRHILHPADWLAGRLCGCFGVSDYCNALKLGYDPHELTWSRMSGITGVSPGLLPEVVQPGTVIGKVSSRASGECGLREGVPVVLAATDGMADLVASGAHQPGDANTTLGTTIVWKALSAARPANSGGIYSHRHPVGMWAPGAASNTGPGSLRWSGEALQPDELDSRASRLFPTSIICYPLRAAGERFPFQCAQAREFTEGSPANEWESYAAQLESIAYIERWGYERLNESGIPTNGNLCSGGRASRSEALTRLRATVMKRTVCRCEHPEAVFGAAILAAAGVFQQGNVAAAISAMTHYAAVVDPYPDLIDRYEDLYHRFRETCFRRGFRT